MPSNWRDERCFLLRNSHFSISKPWIISSCPDTAVKKRSSSRKILYVSSSLTSLMTLCRLSSSISISSSTEVMDPRYIRCEGLLDHKSFRPGAVESPTRTSRGSSSSSIRYGRGVLAEKLPCQNRTTKFPPQRNSDISASLSSNVLPSTCGTGPPKASNANNPAKILFKRLSSSLCPDVTASSAGKPSKGLRGRPNDSKTRIRSEI